MQEKEDKSRKYIKCVVEYGRLARDLEKAILSGCSGEEAINLIISGLKEKEFLWELNRKLEGEIGGQLGGIAKKLLLRQEQIKSYRKLAKDPLATKQKFEEVINSTKKPGQLPLALKKPLASLFLQESPYALGILIERPEMRKIASFLGCREFQGLHLGEGLVVMTAFPGEREGKQLTLLAQRRIADSFSHENYHALSAVIGASGNRTYLDNLENNLEKHFSEGKAVSAAQINEVIEQIIRLAKGELIAEAKIDFGVYQPSGEIKDNFTAAYVFVIGQVLNPIKEDILKLRKGFEEMSSSSNLEDREKVALESRIKNLENFIVDKIGAFLLASNKASNSEGKKMLYFAATFCRLQEFILLPALVEEINKE